jgi:general stress protein 26
MPAGGLDSVKEIIGASAYACLATCDGGRPRVRPVSAFLQDDLTILVAAFAGSRKMKEIEADPRVELCFVDDSHRQVRVEGEAEVVGDVAVKAGVMESELTPAMWKKYLNGPDDPLFGLLRVRPTRFEWNVSGEVTYRTVEPPA